MAFLPKMSATAFATLLLIGILMLGQCCNVVNSTPDMSVKDAACNRMTYNTVTDLYQQSVLNVLNDLLTVTANTQGYDYRHESPFTTIPKAYGHGTCTQTLSTSDCATCILAAYNGVLQACNGYIGGRVFLNDCTIRYEKYPFTDL